MGIFNFIFGQQQQNPAAAQSEPKEDWKREAEEYKRQEEARPYWEQAARQKEFVAATAHMMHPEGVAKQQAHYDELIQKSKQVGEKIGRYEPDQHSDDTFDGLQRITMKNLDARTERLRSEGNRKEIPRTRSWTTESAQEENDYIPAEYVHHPE